MARLTIDIGTDGNSATRDTLRTAFNKVNQNFSELSGNLNLSGNTLLSADTNGNIILDQNGTGYLEIKGNKAKIYGKSKLNGAELMATDLRASVSLVLAGLVALNKTTINRIYHLDRGYENIERKLLKCGVQIRRLW